ncbi:MAG: HD domain-containing protein [Chloroflexota bacterium]
MINWSQDSYLEAYRFAAEAHQGQQYPGTTISYIMHLSFVSMEVLAALANHSEMDGDLAVKCALLHDVLEDTAVSADTLEATFGTDVFNGVAALTKDKDLPKKASMADSLARIQQQPKEVWIVKLADRISNLSRPPQHWNREKIAAYRQEAIQIYDALHEASDFLAKRLNERIEAYQQYV